MNAGPTAAGAKEDGDSTVDGRVEVGGTCVGDGTERVAVGAHALSVAVNITRANKIRQIGLLDCILFPNRSSIHAGPTTSCFEAPRSWWDVAGGKPTSAGLCDPTARPSDWISHSILAKHQRSDPMVILESRNIPRSVLGSPEP